ncbi:MAG: hypothetical protein WCP69_14165, partial [Bacteroidota bacterium]
LGHGKSNGSNGQKWRRRYSDITNHHLPIRFAQLEKQYKTRLLAYKNSRNARRPRYQLDGKLHLHQRTGARGANQSASRRWSCMENHRR